MSSIFSTSIPTTQPYYIPKILYEINEKTTSCENTNKIPFNDVAYIINVDIKDFHIKSQLDINCNINYSDILSKYLAKAQNDSSNNLFIYRYAPDLDKYKYVKETAKFTMNMSHIDQKYNDIIIFFENVNTESGNPMPVTIYNRNKPFLLIVNNSNIIVNVTDNPPPVITTPVEKFTNIQPNSPCDLSSYLPSSHNILLILILIMIVGYYSGYRVVKNQ